MSYKYVFYWTISAKSDSEAGEDEEDAAREDLNGLVEDRGGPVEENLDETLMGLESPNVESEFQEKLRKWDDKGVIKKAAKLEANSRKIRVARRWGWDDGES